MLSLPDEIISRILASLRNPDFRLVCKRFDNLTASYIQTVHIHGLGGNRKRNILRLERFLDLITGKPSIDVYIYLEKRHGVGRWY